MSYILKAYNKFLELLECFEPRKAIELQLYWFIPHKINCWVSGFRASHSPSFIPDLRSSIMLLLWSECRMQRQHSKALDTSYYRSLELLLKQRQGQKHRCNMPECQAKHQSNAYYFTNALERYNKKIPNRTLLLAKASWSIWERRGCRL